ncbi:hypothetical protein [Promicromonospora iranensis]|uniref:HYR domain-containing protein n=1 Tax=Promicromonospora iranensis TaxID=1105144 RepID=A0ABU2CHF8_9MICO|nr:hypothetical protein [Promicromonospora iranensis]MDR7380770.1 hypothetical protein [Promicromonospora iranensis]
MEGTGHVLGDESQVIEFTATDRAGNEEPVRTLELPPADPPHEAP